MENVEKLPHAIFLKIENTLGKVDTSQYGELRKAMK